MSRPLWLEDHQKEVDATAAVRFQYPDDEGPDDRLDAIESAARQAVGGGGIVELTRQLMLFCLPPTTTNGGPRRFIKGYRRMCAMIWLWCPEAVGDQKMDDFAASLGISTRAFKKHLTVLRHITKDPSDVGLRVLPGRSRDEVPQGASVSECDEVEKLG